MAKKVTLPQRIAAELRKHGGSMTYYDLAIALWPARESHRYQQNGGPPGCYMALSAGLRRGKFFVHWSEYEGRIVHFGDYKEPHP